MPLRRWMCALLLVGLLVGCGTVPSTGGAGPRDVSFAADQLILVLTDTTDGPDGAIHSDGSTGTDTTESLPDGSDAVAVADHGQWLDASGLDTTPRVETDSGTEPDLSWVEDGFFDPPEDAGPEDTAVEPRANAPPWLLTMDNATGTLRKVDLKNGKSARCANLPPKVRIHR